MKLGHHLDNYSVNKSRSSMGGERGKVAKEYVRKGLKRYLDWKKIVRKGKFNFFDNPLDNKRT